MYGSTARRHSHDNSTEGYDQLKMVVGESSVKEDAARVNAVREAVGDDVDIMIDANCLLNYPQAQELCRLLEPVEIAWFEEPIHGNDHLLLTDLRQGTSIPLAAGQHMGNIWQHRELIIRGALDYSQPNVCYVGGYTEGLRVAGLARAFNLPIANGEGWLHHNMHLQGGVANGSNVEFHYIMWMASNKLFQGTPQPACGSVELPDRPGLGFELRPDADQYIID